MHCGKDETFGLINREHFVPASLWDKRPPDTIVLPAHKTCNESYQEDDHYFRDVLAMEEGAKGHPEVQKLLAGPIARKFERRFGQVVNLVQNLKLRPVITETGLYIGMHPSFSIDRRRINRVLEKIVKGIFYKARGRPLSESTRIKIVDGPELLNPIFGPMLVHMPKEWSTFGDDVFGCKWLFDSRHNEAIACLMAFYRRRVFLGYAVPDGLADIITQSQ